MKKIILFLFIFISLFTLGENVYAQVPPGQCGISLIEFNPHTGVNEDTEVELTISPNHPDCQQDQTTLKVMISEQNDVVFDTDAYNEFHKFHPNGQPLKIKFKPGNNTCEGGECQYYVDIEVINRQGFTAPNQGSGIGSPVSNILVYSSEFGSETSLFDSEQKKQKAQLVFNCANGECDNNNFEFISSENDFNNQDQTCRVENVRFMPGGEIDESNGPFISPNQQIPVDAEITISDCPPDTQFSIEIWDNDGNDQEAEEARLRGKAPADGIVKIRYIPGNTDCTGTKNGQGYCTYGYTIRKGINEKIYELDNNPADENGDKIGFFCGEGPCDSIEWRVVSHNLIESDGAQILETVEPDFDENSPCYVASSTTPASDDGLEPGEEGIDRDCYEFLAPIPGFGDAQIINGQETGRVSIKLSTLELGDYINTMFQIALGILMVLSVVMIVVGGVQYMTSEAIFQKQVAKESITKAVVGLILGLGIFIILNTINPRLLEINFGSNIEEVSLTTKVYDESQLDYIESIDIAGISIPVDGSVYNDPAFLAYIYHQQGNGGASSILWHSSRNTNNLIRRYGVSPTTLQRQLVANRVNTPNQWVDYFYRKIKASEQKINIIPEAHIEAIDLAASELNVDAEIFKAICLIETSGCAGATTVNSLGYTGLFQFNPTIFNSVKKSANSDIFDPYENAYAAMKLYQQNISFFNQRRNEILNQ